MINRIAAFAWLIMPLLTACDSQNDMSLNDKSLVYCSEGSPETFNPQLVTSGTTIDATSKQLYNTLIEFDPKDNTLVPSLAKSWHVTRDGTKLTFYLRKDVHFHQTSYFTPSRTMNADDVLFSFNRILEPDHPYHLVSGGKYPFFQNGGFGKLVKQVEKINEHTVRFILNYPDSSFLTNLATDFAVILSAEYGEQLIAQEQKPQLDIQPIGTGPFKFKAYHIGSVIRFYRNQAYWQNQVYLEQLIFDITPRNSSRLTKLLANECDVIAYPIAQNKIASRADLSIDEITSFNVGYFGFNTLKPPFDNILVRKAIAHAINRESLIKNIYSDQAVSANTLLPDNSWANDSSLAAVTYSPVTAKNLLDVAGYADGFSMDLWAMPVQRAYNPNALKMAKLIQADLAVINVKVNIVSYEWNTFLRKLALGEHQSFLLGWSADHPDPDNFFTPLLSCASAKTGNNRTFWCNPEFDHLLRQALQTTNLSLRTEYYHQALAMIAEQVPLVPIAHAKRFQARNKKIHGELLHPFGGIDFSKTIKTAGEL